MLKILMLIFELNYSFTFGMVLFDDLQIYKTPDESKIYYAEYEIEIAIVEYFFIRNSIQINMYEEEFLRVYNNPDLI